MSKADEMLEELGYKLVNDNPMCEEYIKCNKIKVQYSMKKKIII